MVVGTLSKVEYEKFPTGAVRDTAAGKPLIGNVSPYFIWEIGAWLAKNAEENGGKYPPYNWEQGIPVRRCYESLMRHLNTWARGKGDEPHLAAGGFNLMLITHVLAMIDQGALPAELDDRLVLNNGQRIIP